MTKADFTECLRHWAKRHGISDGGRDFIGAFIQGYERIVCEHFNKSIGHCPESIIGMYVARHVASLGRKPPSAQIKREVDRLHFALKSLSPETISLLTETVAEIPNVTDFTTYNHLLRAGCDIILDRESKSGRRQETARGNFVRVLAVAFASNLGKKPTSTKGGCFEELLTIALLWHKVDVGEDSRIQEIKKTLRAIGLSKQNLVVKDMFPDG